MRIGKPRIRTIVTLTAVSILGSAGVVFFMRTRTVRHIDFRTLLREERQIAPGVTAITLTSAEKPCRVHLVKITLDEANLSFRVWQGTSGLCQRAKLGHMAEAMERTTGANVVAGMNGDFFNIKNDSGTRGNPVGLSVMAGRLLTTGWRHRTDTYESICTFEDEKPEIVRLTFDGNVASSMTNLPIHAYNAAPFHSGEDRYSRIVLYDSQWRAPIPEDGVRLVFLDKACRHGRIVGPCPAGSELEPGEGALVGFGDLRRNPLMLTGDVSVQISLYDGRGRCPREAMRIWNRPLVQGRKQPTERGMRDNFPRSMFGLGPGVFVFFVADGRRPFISESLLADDASEILLREGCTEAGQMDGGGSATLWLEDDYMNTPSDIGGARRISNGLFFISHPSVQNLKKNFLKPASRKEWH